MDTTIIAKNIKKYRLLNNMTQEQLAEKLDLDAQYYAQLERGIRNFSIDKIINICNIFQIGIDEIVILDNQPQTDNNELYKNIIEQLQALNTKQLLLVNKFLQEIVPYIN